MFSNCSIEGILGIRSTESDSYDTRSGTGTQQRGKTSSALEWRVAQLECEAQGTNFSNAAIRNTNLHVMTQDPTADRVP